MEILDLYLPTEILCQLFAVYLLTKGVTRFGRAICNKVKRLLFLLFLQSNDIVLSGYYGYLPCRNSEFIIESKYVRCLNLRGVKVNHFTWRGGLSIETSDKIADFSPNFSY
jgi:hypothetical protein